MINSSGYCNNCKKPYFFGDTTLPPDSIKNNYCSCYMDKYVPFKKGLGEEFENQVNTWKNSGLLLCIFCHKDLKDDIDKGEQIQLEIELNHDDNKNMIVFVSASHPNQNWCKK